MSQPDPKFILIVDDSPLNLVVLSQALEAVGYLVKMANDGEEALALVEQHQPELILLDVQMPKMDGFEACRRLQADPTTQTIPIIFMTALADRQDKLTGLSLGAVDYITKPFEEEEVLARVKIHWRLRQLTDNLEQQVAERTQALQQAQLQIIQQEKLSTLGQLVAGVAHEINNPINFVTSNIRPAKEYLTELTELLNLYQTHYFQAAPEINQKIKQMDLEFVLRDFAELLDSMQMGAGRIKEIAGSLRKFARVEQTSCSTTDLHEGLETALLLLKHRLKADNERPEIAVIKNYADLPLVECFPGMMNQVFMNLLANAVDALEEAWQKDQRDLTIEIETAISGYGFVAVRITDSGLGISDDIQDKLFEPFFTTKTADKGTGLGLSISKQIVEEKHKGTLLCHSSSTQGTQFSVEIPIQLCS